MDPQWIPLVIPMPRETGKKLIAQNKKARHDYSIEDVFEAGIMLTGTEVKSLRAGRASLVDGFAQYENGEVWLRQIHIPVYDLGTWTNHEPRRARKLLLRKDEIKRIANVVKDTGVTLIPLSLYFKDGFAKVEIAVARGRKSYDKRQAIAERDSKREAQRLIGRRNKGVE
jgi:SsrA-binding protein